MTLTTTPMNLLDKCCDPENSDDDYTDMKHEEQFQREEEGVIIPPDGGWGWIVAMAAFMCNMTADGNLFCFGVFLPHMAESFGVAESRISVIGSLTQGTFMLVGPFTGIIVDMYGLRVTAIVGAILSTAGYLSSYFVYNLYVLYLTHGILIGIGFGFIYMSSLIAVGFYFEKWRALATGIGVCGSGVGTVIFGPLHHYLIAKFGWRNVLLFEAALTLLCVLYGACFRPLKPQKRLEKAISILDCESQPLNSTKDDQVSSGQAFSISKNPDYLISFFLRKQYVRRTSAPEAVWDRQKEHPGIFYSKEDLLDKKILNLNRESTKTSNAKMMSRPLSRRDIFYSGNLARLPETRSDSSKLVSSSDEDVCLPSICKKKIYKTSFLMLQLRLLKSPSFVLYSIHGLSVMLGFLTPFLFSAVRARERGIKEDVAVWLVSSIGIANTCGKILSGFLVSATGMNSLLVNAVASFAGGIFLIFSGVSMSAAHQFTVSVVFGLSIACFTSLKSVALVELLGLDRLTNAFGLFLLFLGIGSLTGPPVTAIIMERTGNYDVPFYIAGCCFLISSVILVCLKFVNRWEMHRNQSQASTCS